MRNAILSIILAAFAAACGANEGVLRDGKPDPAATPFPPAATGVEADVNTMLTAGYGYVYVIRRADGAEIDAADRKVLKTNTDTAKRREESESGRAFVIATTEPLAAEKLAALSKRFEVRTAASAPPPAPDQAK